MYITSFKIGIFALNLNTYDMEKYGLGRTFVLSSLLLASACVNTEYDLEKEIETEATLFENVALPVGNINKMTIGEILFTDEATQMIRCIENGDYYLDFTAGSFETKVEIPSFSIDAITLEDQTIHFTVPSYVSGMTGSGTDLVIKYSDLVPGGLSFNMDIDIDTQIPAELVDVSEVYLDATMLCNFTVNTGKAYVAKGYEIAFPDYIYISKTDKSAAYEVVDRNVIRFLADTEIGSSSPLSLSLGFDELRVPEGAIIEEAGVRKLKIYDLIGVKGDMYINTKDFASIPEELLIVMNIGFRNLSVTEARVTLDLTSELPSEEIVLGELPDILKGEEISVDLYNPYMELTVANGSPFNFYVTGDVTAYNAKGSQNVHLGAGGPETVTGEEVYITASSTKTFVFSRRPMGTLPETSTNIEIPAIANLIKDLPDRISIHDMVIYPVAEDVLIKAGSSYAVTADYAVGSPMSFDQDLNLEFNQEIKGMGLAFDDVSVHTAEVKMSVINSIPLELSIEAACMDEMGNILSDTVLYMDNEIPAGSQDTPSETPVRIIMENSAGALNVDGLVLTIKAVSSDSSYHGVCLNKEQGLAIRDIILSLPDGIGVEF